MSTDNNDMCVNCGKGEEDSISLKSCTACKMVKYCSRDCQRAHRSQHKKECKKRAAELHDEALFTQPPQKEDCPICFLRMPTLHTGRRYNSCCGKIICCGCIYAGSKMDGNADQLCPFCRVPAPRSDEEIMERVMKRVEMDDAQAIHNKACYYQQGRSGLPQDYTEALELWHRAGELGNARSYYNIGVAYFIGAGVARDEKKATHYYELAAIGGHEQSRHNLGHAEERAGSHGRALKHLMINVGSGQNDSLNAIKQFYSKGYATKDDYAKALKAYQAYLSEIKSDDRDKAAAFSDKFKYYE